MNSGSIDWIEKNVDYILNAQNFSDEKLILMDKVKKEDRYPKEVLRKFVCQYMLSKHIQICLMKMKLYQFF